MNSSAQQTDFTKTIVILGPTASGKTGVSIKIAQEIERQASQRGLTGAEIISADSRAIYKYMDIGTAKPSYEEQEGITHFGLDLVEPGERFTVADWQRYAREKIGEIQARGHLPIIAGGTGLYIDALVYDYDFSVANKASQADRQQMNNNFVLIGIDWSPEELRARITQRANNLFNDKLYKETKFLVEKYGWGSQAMKSNIYQFAWAYLNGEYDLERAKELFILDDWHLAKRQLTWFRRNKNIKWLPLAEVETYVLKYIQDGTR